MPFGIGVHYMAGSPLGGVRKLTATEVTVGMPNQTLSASKDNPTAPSGSSGIEMAVSESKKP